MPIKEILDRIKTTLGADAPAEISALIADAVREAQDILDSLSAANKESASRKAKIRELEAELEAKNAELEKASSSNTKAELERLKKIEAEYLAHKQEEEQKLIQAWQEKAKIFEVKDTDPLYETVSKIKDQFVLEGDITPEIAQKNLAAMQLLETAGVFNPPAKEASGYAPAANNEKPKSSDYTFGQELKNRKR